MPKKRKRTDTDSDLSLFRPKIKRILTVILGMLLGLVGAVSCFGSFVLGIAASSPFFFGRDDAAEVIRLSYWLFFCSIVSLTLAVAVLRFVRKNQ